MSRSFIGKNPLITFMVSADFDMENYDKIDQTINNLLKRGVFATPAIIINDRLVYMTNSYGELSRLLDSEL